MFFLVEITILVHPEQISVVFKSGKQKKKKKKKKKDPHLFFYNFSYTSISSFPSSLLQFSFFSSQFSPLFPFFPIRKQKFPPSEVSGGHSAPNPLPHPRLLRHWSVVSVIDSLTVKASVKSSSLSRIILVAKSHFKQIQTVCLPRDVSTCRNSAPLMIPWPSLSNTLRASRKSSVVPTSQFEISFNIGRTSSNVNRWSVKEII